MAVLESIRSRMGIVVSLVIGLALLAFILGDFLGQGSSIFTADRFEIAKISGKSIHINDFEEEVNKLTEVYKFNTGQSNLNDETLQSVREQSWQQLINEQILGAEYEKIGLLVSSKEVLDMVQGANPHPYIRQLFTNPETQEFNRVAIVQFIQSLSNPDSDPARKNYWFYIENQIISEREQSKYLNLIRKGIYVTSLQVKAEAAAASKTASFSYIMERYALIPDSVVKVKESDLNTYLKLHSKEYEQEASRDIEYISFDILPSPEDFQAAQKWIADIKPEFESIEEVKQFVNLNSDASFVDRFLSADELSDSVKILFNAKPGTMVGPFFENNSFKLARLVETKNLPDSVKARHILVKPQGQTKEDYDKAKALADSLNNVVKKGGDFAELAKQFSTDGSAANGGDLGWFREGMMVKPFNDACFEGKVGEATVVETQFGIHVIQVTEKSKESKKVKVGIIERRVDPSPQTEQAIYQKASSFAGNNNTGDKFAEALKQQGQIPQVANYLNENMKEVPGLPQSRELVRWAFRAEPNTISGVLSIGNKFIIARLTQLREKGEASLENVKDQVMAQVIKEKKAQMLIDKFKTAMSGTSTIEDLASKTNTTISEANDISFASFALPSAGFEPAVIATATSIPVNTMSAPVKGNNGVFVVVIKSVSETEANIDMIKNRLAMTNLNRVNYEAVNSLKKLADIVDNRSKFY